MPVALCGVRIWDGVAERAGDALSTISIEGSRIAAISPGLTPPEGARAVHLDGAVAMPGLIDAHVHLALDPSLAGPEQQLEGEPERQLRLMAGRAEAMLRAGITTARDLGGGEWLELELRDRIERGELPGPRLLCAGQPLTRSGGHCHFWGGEAEGPGARAAVVRRQLDRGVDWVKVMATGGLFTQGTATTRAQFGVAALEQVVTLARAEGRPVAAHCHGTQGIRNAVEAGVASIEHCSFAGPEGFGTDLDLALADRMAERGVWVSATVNGGWARRLESAGRSSDFVRRMSGVFAALRRAGVPLVASTDAGIPGVEHHRLSRGLAAFARYADLGPVEALRAATSESARLLGLERETGALRAGLSADVLVLAADPLDDLAHLERPRLVVARGRVLDRAGAANRGPAAD